MVGRTMLKYLPLAAAADAAAAVVASDTEAVRFTMTFCHCQSGFPLTSLSVVHKDIYHASYNKYDVPRCGCDRDKCLSIQASTSGWRLAPSSNGCWLLLLLLCHHLAHHAVHFFACALPLALFTVAVHKQQIMLLPLIRGVLPLYSGLSILSAVLTSPVVACRHTG